MPFAEQTNSYYQMMAWIEAWMDSLVKAWMDSLVKAWMEAAKCRVDSFLDVFYFGTLCTAIFTGFILT